MMTATKEAVHVFSSKIRAVHTLRVNSKSLAAEAKIIRQEAKRCGPYYYFGLDHHRRGRLREEARVTHLALAFIRGTPYKSVEQKTNKPVQPPIPMREKKNDAEQQELKTAV